VRSNQAVDVMTVDDQAIFRAVAREVIEATPGFEPAGEATSGEEALRMVGEFAPHLALVDVRMPGMDGIETAQLLKAAHPSVVVVLISLEEADDLPSSARGCGAAALVRKQDFGPALLRRMWAAYGRTDERRGR
jgi:two-component system, NarL family, invasion response regulator UvrY